MKRYNRCEKVISNFASFLYDSVTGFALELHEDHFDDKFDEGTLKSSSMSIEQRIRRQSETLQPDLLKSCSFKLEVNDRPIYGLSQEEAISLIKSFEADPELKRYNNT